jgi:LPXTG-motif cell wall-anchored protein
VFWKAILFWVGVLFAFAVLFEFRPASSTTVAQWSTFLPLVGLLLGLIVVVWKRRKEARDASQEESTKKRE